jgi:hypothetical protein
MADFQNDKTPATQTRTNVAPVRDYTDKRGNVIPAGTVGNLAYTGGSRGWSFYTATNSWSVKASDLFKFVPASDVVSAALGHDLTAGEQANCTTEKHGTDCVLTMEQLVNWSRTRGYDLTPCQGCGAPEASSTCCERRGAGSPQWLD